MVLSHNPGPGFLYQFGFVTLTLIDNRIIIIGQGLLIGNVLLHFQSYRWIIFWKYGRETIQLQFGFQFIRGLLSAEKVRETEKESEMNGESKCAFLKWPK